MSEPTTEDAPPIAHADPDELRAALAASPAWRVPPEGTDETAVLAERVAAGMGATLTLETRRGEVHAVLAALWRAVGSTPCTRDWVTCAQVPHSCEQRGRVERVLARLARDHGVTLPGVDPVAATATGSGPAEPALDNSDGKAIGSAGRASTPLPDGRTGPAGAEQTHRPDAALLAALDALAATDPAPRRVTGRNHWGEHGFTLSLGEHDQVWFNQAPRGTVELAVDDTSRKLAEGHVAGLSPAVVAELIVRLAALPHVRDLVRVTPRAGLAGLVSHPDADPDNNYDVRVTPPAAGPGSDDAGPTFHVDLPDGSVTVRRRLVNDAVPGDAVPEDAGEQTDTVITITGFDGPLEVITRTVGHRFG